MNKKDRMKIVVVASILFISSFPVLMASSDIGQTQTPPALTNADIIKMLAGNLGETVIIARIEQGPSQFDLSPDALVSLKKSGATDHLIEVMIRASSATQQTETHISVPSEPTKSALTTVPAYSERIEKVKVQVGSEKEISGVLYNDAGNVCFASNTRSEKWNASELLAKHTDSYALITSLTEPYKVDEKFVSTLSNGQVITFSLKENANRYGPPIIDTIMMAASYQFLQKGVEQYQPSGGRTEDTLIFRALHLGGGLLKKIHLCVGQLKVSLRTGTVIFEDAKDPKYSFELPPSDVDSVEGYIGITEQTGQWFSSEKLLAEFGLTRKRVSESTEFDIWGKKGTKVKGIVFALPFDNNIEGILSPAVFIEYLVRAYMR